MYHLDTPVLETERLLLHAPQLVDWEPLAAFLTSDRAHYVGGSLSRDRAWRGFGHLVGHWVLRGYGMFFVTAKGTDTAIGMVGPWFHEGWPEQELGWSVALAQRLGATLDPGAAKVEGEDMVVYRHSAPGVVA